METPDKPYEVVVSDAADRHMSEHYTFLAQVSVGAARRLLEELMRDMRTIGKHPFMCPVYDRPYLPPGKYRSMLSCKRYLIVYCVSDNTVYVDDIQDCRQDEDSHSLLH